MSPKEEELIADLETSMHHLNSLLNRSIQEKIKMVQSGDMDQILKVCIFLLDQEVEWIKAIAEPNEEIEYGTTGIQNTTGN